MDPNIAIEYFKLALSKYSDFHGRSRRSEYWYFVLVQFVVSGLLSALSTIMGLFGFMSFLFGLAMFVPGLAVAVRRLHDTGRSGWFLLLAFLPVIGVIVLIVWLASDGEPGPNEYGPNPKDEDHGGVRDILVEDDLVG